MGILDSISKPENAAAIWSAVAATFSAAAAYLSWRAQIFALRHTFRPELHFSGWHRIKRAAPEDDLLVFTYITNAGRDSAKQVVVNAAAIADDQRPLYMMGTINVPALSVNETATVNGEIALYWKNAPKNLGSGKAMQVRIQAWCWDALNVRHLTTLSLMLVEDLNSPVANSAKLAPGTYMSYQTVTSTPVWRLRLQRTLRRVPLIGCICAMTPNPSLKRSANGRPPGPGWRYAVHCRQPGPGVLPSSPA